MDYKDTLHLPTTDFPMRASLPEREPAWLAFWEQIRLTDRLDALADQRPRFVLHDGPPYANGNIHLGTALNKILKDIVVKSKFAQGMYAPYIPGWDCHGLPIEQKVAQELRQSRQSLSRVELRRLCREYALRFVDVQRTEFMRLGCLGHWHTPYLTLHPEYEAEELRQFAILIEEGHVYRSMKPVYWCPSYETALAEAEVEYATHASPSIYVLFPSIDLETLPEIAQHGPFGAGRPLRVLIWTTTPWTLPANLGIAFHPALAYALVEVPGWGVMVIADDLVNRVMAETGQSAFRVLGKVPGQAFEYRKCRHPFLETVESLCVLAEYVTLEQGSGCVHTAPGHGQEDYLTGQKYGLPTYSPVDAKGRFTDEFAPCAGKDVFAANADICALLRRHGALLWEGRVEHEYPHDWRDKKPVIFRATPQWFISLEHGNLRRRLLEAVDCVQWVPKWGRERIYSMIANRAEWCISRQRAWGVPIPALTDETADETLLLPDIVRAVAGVVATHGTDAWFEALEGMETEGACALWNAIRASLPDRPDHRLKLGEDILDVWFDSGVSHQAVLRHRDRLTYPADMYLEGSDQHRGWFQSSLTTAVAALHGPPYRTVLTHGYVVDEQGRKQSKSLGNVVRPQEVIDEYGADVLRLWVSSEDFRNDISLSPNIVKRMAEAYRRIRNTCRFLLGNLHGYSPDRSVPRDQLLEIDRWMLQRLANVERQVQQAYEAYEFHRLYHALNNLCVTDLSALYLDVLKDRLYCSAAASVERLAAQTVLHRTVVSLVQMIAPVLSFTAEEVWQTLRRMGLVDEESVFLACGSPSQDEAQDEVLAERWSQLLLLRGEVAKALETERKAKRIGHSLDAEVRLFLPHGNLRSLAERYRDITPIGDNLESLFIVSHVTLLDSVPTGEGILASDEIPSLVVQVARAPGEKCERCWNYRTTVGTIASYPTLCTRCATVLDQIAPSRCP